MRFAKGSGIDGLAGMAAVRESYGVRLLRPLLGFARDALRAFLTSLGQDWIDDPSTDDPRYARGRLTAAAAALAAEGRNSGGPLAREDSLVGKRGYGTGRL